MRLGPLHFRKLEKAVAVRNFLLEEFSGKFRRCWKIIRRFSGSTKCYPCQGLGIFRPGKWLLENWPRLRERCWIFSSETATAFLSSFDHLERLWLSTRSSLNKCAARLCFCMPWTPAANSCKSDSKWPAHCNHPSGAVQAQSLMTTAPHACEQAIANQNSEVWTCSLYHSPEIFTN